MTTTERLRQYIGKASFSSETDRFSTLECLGEIAKERASLIENVEDAAEEWARYVEADTAPMTLPKYIAAAIAKTANGNK